MLGNKFRPWGHFNFVMNRIDPLKWDIIGCVSTEDRFFGLINRITKVSEIGNVLFYKIEDPISIESDLKNDILSKNINILYSLGITSLVIEDHKLFEPYDIFVQSIEKFIKTSNGNIIFDISTFPKRFFFPILRIIFNKKVNNLIVTYTKPITYSRDDLASNPEEWSPLPLFMPVDFPEYPPELAIVGVGFMPFGLSKLLYGKYTTTPVKFILPFPPGPPNYQRMWEFMRKIEKTYKVKSSDSLIRINSLNCPDAYDYIFNASNSGQMKIIFAPYGPKTISLAMCLYASRFNSPVYYTQPTFYNLNYSKGTSETFTYVIRLSDVDFY